MTKKKTFLLMASMLAMSYYGFAQSPSPQVRDTVEVGVLYLVDPMTFQTTTGYVKRVMLSEFTYQRKPDNNPLADSVTYVKVKVPKSVSYFLIKTIQSKETWTMVKVVQDFDVNFKLK